MSYSFLLELGWKSSLISGAALLLVKLLRSRSAADRGAVLRAGVAMLLLLPVVAYAFPALVVETPAPAAAPAAVVSAAAPRAAEAAFSPAELVSASAPASASDWNDPGILFLLLYLGGLAMVGGRLAAGLWTLRRWTGEARPVTSAAWLQALDRSGAGPEVRLLVCDEIASPLSWGWRKPVILLDPDALAQPGDADAILAHEMAHVLRRDWLTLVLSRTARAIFWFNPLVWLLDREVCQQAEEAADSEAVARVEPARYAQALLDWARHSAAAGAVPANAMAAPERALRRRVRAIVEGRIATRSGSFWTFAAIGLCVAIAGPVSALELVQAAPQAPDPPEAPLAPPAPEAADVPPPAVAAVAAVAEEPPLAPAAPGTAPPPPAQVHAAALPPHPAHMPQPPAPPPLVDGEAIAAQVSSAVLEANRSAELSRAAALRAAEAAHGAIDADFARRIAETARRAAAAGLAHGADGMLRGADGMERGARKMQEEAARLRQRDYRDRVIAKARARGETVTHEELIDAAEEMDDGADEMRDGAREMREAAEEMRREGRGA